MSALQRLEAPIVIPTGGYAYTLDETGIGTAALSLAAGTHYFWTNEGLEGTADAGNLSLLARLAADMTTNSPDSATYTVTLDATSASAAGALTISTTGPNFRFTGVTAGLLALMGFSSASLGAYASSHTSNLGAVQALWIPDCPVNPLYGLNSDGKPMSQTVPMVAPDGTTSFFHGSKQTRNQWAFALLTKARAVQGEENTANESFEQFWTDAIRGEAEWAVASRSIAFVKNRSTGEGAAFTAFHVLNSAEPGYQRVSEQDDNYYQLVLDMVKA